MRKNIENLEDKPELIGHLNKDFGYNGFELITKGSEVFYYEGQFFFYMIPLKGGVPVKQIFAMKTLEPCIYFIPKD